MNLDKKSLMKMNLLIWMKKKEAIRILSKRYDYDKIIYNEGKREFVKIAKMNLWRYHIVNIV